MFPNYRQLLNGCCVIVPWLAGCGSGEPFERFEVAGTVVYQGNPVEHGSIRLEPTDAGGEEAPTTYAKVEGGEFYIPKDEGPAAGTYNLYVSGFDHSKMDPNPPPHVPIETPELFPTYQTQVEIPPPDGELEVEVPDRPAPRRR
jgi:hypothetical protein